MLRINHHWIRLAAVLAFCVLGGSGGTVSHAADWPMWRFDAGRSAALPAELPADVDVSVQDQRLPAAITLADGQTEVREVQGVLMGDQLHVRLIAKQGLPMLSGIELQKVKK